MEGKGREGKDVGVIVSVISIDESSVEVELQNIQ